MKISKDKVEGRGGKSSVKGTTRRVEDVYMQRIRG